MELLVQVRILAGQLRLPALLLALAPSVAAGAAAALQAEPATPLHAEPTAGPPADSLPWPSPPVVRPAVRSSASTPVPARSDSLDAHRAARDAQARFERLRLQHMPRGPVGGSTPCDEVVGRFCSWYGDGGDWAPEPEPPELRRHRETLLVTLDSVGRLLPGDDWVAGQRVWYRAETGAWREALGVARRCAASGWWCDALRGLALHGSGRYEAADRAFRAALDGMEPRESRWWRFPRRAVDGEAREALEAAEAAEMDGDVEGARVLLDRFWLLADPLWLVPGNDRRTAHYARWTASMVRVGARTPYRLSWGRDLEELTVRHGWELGWEKGWPRVGAETDVMGHKHPEGRDFLPPGRALLDPASAGPGELEADRTRPRSLYAPGYAPLLLPMDGQRAVFPRGDRMAVVATQFLPEDTTRHREHQHPRPWLEPGDQAGLPDRAGLYLAPAGPSLEPDDGLAVLGDTGSAAPRLLGTEVVDPPDHGALVVEAPAGRWVLSVERWSAGTRRAGRWRQGLAWEATPPDVATLSDLLLVVAGVGPPASLGEAAAAALPTLRLPAGTRFGVVWELGGVGWRAEAPRYALALRREGGNLLQRAGRWLGILGEDEALRLSWEEEGPGEPGSVLRHLDVDPGTVEPGRYRLLLEVRLPGRGPLRSELPLEIVAGGGANAR